MENNGPIYALNLFDIIDREEYLAYSKRSAHEVKKHGGKVVALGRFREAKKGDITPARCSSWWNGNLAMHFNVIWMILP